ncbi:type 2 isopentenyl-diphosphate Delta-isomerase [Helcococcus bovis]|uniref:type 2 isopentenyl-diphosphate Delta-isomerase n=1 Tax=Helcococcus bovis TaxID=3153252 RepID=UPI0038B9C7FA
MDNQKDLYLENSLISSFVGNPLFDDIYLEHNSLPEINFDEISTESEIFGKKISFPLIINAMVGGSEKGFDVNQTLFSLAMEFKLPFSVGSQDGNFDNEESKLYLERIGESEKSEVVVLSNLSAKSDEKSIENAMNLINSDGVTLYLNSAQEIISSDGDTNFRNVLENIRKLSKTYSSKMIIKEKSMGMTKLTVDKLVDAGVKYIDVSGSGGTNFIEIENLRNYKEDFSDLYSWGIPTAKSIINARESSQMLKIIASGGIKTGLDIAKALIIGADYVGVSGELLKYLLHGGYDQAKNYLEDLIYKTKVVMFLLGVKNIEELKNVDYKIVGRLKEIL